MTVTSAFSQILAHAAAKLAAVFVSFLAVLSASAPRGIPTTTTSTPAPPAVITTTVVKSSGGHTVRSGKAPTPARRSPSTTATLTTLPMAVEGEQPTPPINESANYKFQTDYRWACVAPITWAASANTTPEARSEIAATFDELHGLTALTFVPTDDFNNANIQITFVGDDWRQVNPGKWGHTELFERDNALVLAQVSLSDSLAEPLLHTVIRHEFGHALGLDHVDGNEVMAQEGADTYQAGDIAGLKIAGKACQ